MAWEPGSVPAARSNTQQPFRRLNRASSGKNNRSANQRTAAQGHKAYGGIRVVEGAVKERGLQVAHRVKDIFEYTKDHNSDVFAAYHPEIQPSHRPGVQKWEALGWFYKFAGVEHSAEMEIK
jgi:pyruvate-formate lyase